MGTIVKNHPIPQKSTLQPEEETCRGYVGNPFNHPNPAFWPITVGILYVILTLTDEKHREF